VGFYCELQTAAFAAAAAAKDTHTQRDCNTKKRIVKTTKPIYPEVISRCLAYRLQVISWRRRSGKTGEEDFRDGAVAEGLAHGAALGGGALGRLGGRAVGRSGGRAVNVSYGRIDHGQLESKAKFIEGGTIGPVAGSF